MVGHGHRRHPLRGHGVHQFRDVAGPVQQRVIGVAMQMYERSFRHSQRTNRDNAFGEVTSIVTGYTVTVRLSWRDFPKVLHRTLVSAFDDGTFSIAKGAAYSAILSFFPVLAT